MKLHQLTVTVVLIGLVSLVNSKEVMAEGIFSTWFGTTSASLSDTTNRRNKPTFGASLGSFGTIAGFEVDLGLMPNFFGDAEVVGSNNLMTFTANLLVGPSLGRVRPYGIVGAGLLRTSDAGINDQPNVRSNNIGINAGGGAIAYLTDSIGIRGDIRMFRSTGDNEESFVDVLDLELGSFSFWRIYIGLSMRF